MKKYNLEATDENVLDSIRYNRLGRLDDIKDFIKLLDSIDYNAFISLDGAWGDGKTFFVREIEMTLKYYNKNSTGKDISERERTVFVNSGHFADMDIERLYVPIYFNAWLYDNHSDALMALLLVAIKQSNKLIDTKIDCSKSEKVCTVLDGIGFWKSNNWENIREKFTGTDILSETYLLEDIRELIKGVFNDILVEEGSKLIIFIDELDRCKPTFAVEMLESIKNFWDDDRIIFVMSVNKAQLIHTIENHYGQGFNSSGYLNKFFDFNIQLPIGNNVNYLRELGLVSNDSNWITQCANDLQRYYNLSLRDTALYFGKINNIVDKYRNITASDNWYIMMLFVPIICVLDIVDIKCKRSIIDGIGWENIKQIIGDNEKIKNFVIRLNSHIRGEISEIYDAGLEELCNIYKFAFNEDGQYSYYEGNFEIERDFKKVCLKVCNEI